MNQDLKFIGICETIKSFGTLCFGERHHPWIRHVSIALSEIDKRNKSISFSCYGVSTVFKKISISVFNNCFDENGLLSKESSFEDELEKEFLYKHILTPETNIWDYSNWESLIHERQLVYQDYKFAKAKASIKLSNKNENEYV